MGFLDWIVRQHPIVGPMFEAMEEPSATQSKALTMTIVAREALRLLMWEVSLLKLGPCCITCQRPMRGSKELAEFTSVQCGCMWLESIITLGNGWELMKIDAISAKLDNPMKELAKRIHDTGLTQSAQMACEGDDSSTHVATATMCGLTVRASNVGYTSVRIEVGLT